MEKQDILQLGGNIELSGFKECDYGVMLILKKIIGNYARKMNDVSEQFEKLSLTMKTIHSKEKSEKYEIHAMLIDKGNSITGEATERNLFVAVDSALKKIEKNLRD